MRKREAWRLGFGGVGIWRELEPEPQCQKSQGGRALVLKSTWMQEMQRLGQRSELFVTIVGVASSQIEARRGAEWRGEGEK